MADTLATLARLRKLEEGQARRALGSAVAREVSAAQAAEAAIAKRRCEAEAASSDAADPLAGAYAAWLPVSNRDVAAARAEATAREADRRQAADALTASKAALEAVDILLTERARLRRLRAGRRDQSRLDELGQRLGRS